MSELQRLRIPMMLFRAPPQEQASAPTDYPHTIGVLFDRCSGVVLDGLSRAFHSASGRASPPEDRAPSRPRLPASTVRGCPLASADRPAATMM